MDKQRNRAFLLIAGLLVLVLGVIGSVALAQDATPEAETPEQEETTPETDDFSLRGLGHWGGFGRGDDGAYQENLAEALGITVAELAAAQEEAYAASLADAVAAGLITQEQADQIVAVRALKSYLDREAILAEALGMTVEELETALADGQSLVDIMVEQGIDSATLQASVQAAYEAALAQAVADGVITQAQADDTLSGESFNLFGGRGGRGGHGHHGGRGFRFGAPSVPDDSTTPDTTDTSLDA